MLIADLPAVVQQAITALERDDPAAALLFCRWLVETVCGEVWTMPTDREGG